MALVDKDILKEIYEKIFLRELDYSINIFLCGSNPNNTDSLRHLIYEEIKDNPRYNVVFPEWLFSNLLAMKEYNLFDLENDLALNVDAIVLPLEGLGTMAELGAFASFDKLRAKIIVINDQKYRRDRSFITLGPVSVIMSEDKRNVIYYSQDKLDGLKKKVFNRIKNMSSDSSKFDIRNLFNLSRFILYIIAIFQPIEKELISNLLKKFKKEIPTHYIDPCLEILLEKMKINRDIAADYSETYFLTESGHNFIYENLLPKLNIIKIFSQARAKILNAKFRGKNFNIDEGRKKFLA